MSLGWQDAADSTSPYTDYIIIRKKHQAARRGHGHAITGVAKVIEKFGSFWLSAKRPVNHVVASCQRRGHSARRPSCDDGLPTLVLLQVPQDQPQTGTVN